MSVGRPTSVAEEHNDEQNASAAVAAEAYDSGLMRKREGQALKTRDRAPHFVQRGTEHGATALLIGVKKSFADGLDCLSYIVYKGGQYKQQRTQKVANTELSFAELSYSKRLHSWAVQSLRWASTATTER